MAAFESMARVLGSTVGYAVYRIREHGDGDGVECCISRLPVYFMTKLLVSPVRDEQIPSAAHVSRAAAKTASTVPASSSSPFTILRASVLHRPCPRPSHPVTTNLLSHVLPPHLGHPLRHVGSTTTLDRRIRNVEVEVLREGRRVYVRVEGPEYLSDEELLRRAKVRTDEMEGAVRRGERIAAELERERDAAKRAAAGCEDAYGRLEDRYLADVRSMRRRGEGPGGWPAPSAVLAVLLISAMLVEWRMLT